MFYLNREVELSAALLQKMINKFQVEVEPKLNKRKHYYDGIQKILSKRYSDEALDRIVNRILECLEILQRNSNRI